MNTALDFFRVWEGMGSHWLPDEMRALICRAIPRLPENVAEFALYNCSFIAPDKTTKGETYPAPLFAHPTRRGRTARNHWVIWLAPSILNDEQDGQYTVAHEVAHAWLKHQVMDGNFLAEEQADDLVKSWGFDVPKYRLKVHAGYRRAMKKSEANGQLDWAANRSMAKKGDQ